MPLYEYECKKCGHRFEKIQKFSDKMVKKCPECGGQVEQMISAPAVQFKGSGWYVTDYAKKSSSPGSSSGDSVERQKRRQAQVGWRIERKLIQGKLLKGQFLEREFVHGQFIQGKSAQRFRQTQIKRLRLREAARAVSLTPGT